MTQINLKHVKKAWGDQELFTDVSFSVSYGERIGLVGANGSGKSTLFNILAGRDEPDSGTVFIPARSSSALLKQNPLSDLELAAMERGGFPEEARRYMRLLHMDPDRTAALMTLSGGERTKLALSLILCENPKLLLLDEPTNHLDFAGTQMLISLLCDYPGTILAVSHDRYFLDRTVTRVLEIEQGRILEYPGNYSYYRDCKARLFQEKMHRFEEGRKEQKRISEAISQVKQWSEKAHRDSTKPDPSGLTMGVKEKKRAKAKKMDKKVKNDIRRLEKLVTSVEPRPAEEKSIRFSIASDSPHGRRILEASGLTKAYGDNVLFADSSFTAARGEHIALWGPNGCGKSTLIAMITGDETADSGELRVSPSSRPYVLPQTFSGFLQKQTVRSYLLEEIGHLSGSDRALLANMDITARHLEQPLRTLSFGEQMRIKLAELILTQRDFIILDEPTNHLDLPMREMLENMLAEYPGTLLLVSHDLYFLRKTCSKVLVFEDGRIQRIEDSFEEYMDKKKW